jgi:hypothetical protein
VIGNSEQTGAYAHEVRQLVYKWLNRRSQRISYSYAGFNAAWAPWQKPSPKVNETASPRYARQTRPRSA